MSKYYSWANTMIDLRTISYVVFLALYLLDFIRKDGDIELHKPHMKELLIAFDGGQLI